MRKNVVIATLAILVILLAVSGAGAHPAGDCIELTVNGEIVYESAACHEPVVAPAIAPPAPTATPMLFEATPVSRGSGEFQDVPVGNGGDQNE